MTFELYTPAVRPAIARTSYREEADDYRGLIAQLNDDWRVVECRGAIQWILQRKVGQRDGAGRWSSVAFHRHRDTLERAVHTRCGQVDPDQAELIDALPALIGGAA